MIFRPATASDWMALSTIPTRLLAQTELIIRALRFPISTTMTSANTIGIGAAYTWKSGATVSFTTESRQRAGKFRRRYFTTRMASERRARALIFGFRRGRDCFTGMAASVWTSLTSLNDRTVINFQSAFSGTRFQQARRILLSVFGNF